MAFFGSGVIRDPGLGPLLHTLGYVALDGGRHLRWPYQLVSEGHPAGHAWGLWPWAKWGLCRESPVPPRLSPMSGPRFWTWDGSKEIAGGRKVPGLALSLTRRAGETTSWRPNSSSQPPNGPF